MAKRSSGGVEGVQKPESYNVARRKVDERRVWRPSQGGALVVQDFDQAAQDRHDGFAGPDLQARRYEPRVEDEAPGAVALETRDRQGRHAFRRFEIEQQAHVLTA